MINFKKIKAAKMISLALLCVMLAGALCSCSSAPFKSSKEELSFVGSVGEYDVMLDELYFLVNTYRDSLDIKYGRYETLQGADADRYESELRTKVYENIIANYAILELCKTEGLTLEDDGLDKRVQDYIDHVIETDFEGKRSVYKKNLRELGVTDRCVRFGAACDLLYSDFKTKLLEDGKIESDEQKILERINGEFVRTVHIAVFNDNGEDVSANRAKIEAALAKYQGGDMTMHELIGSTYNEDFSITTFDGYYFTKGSMDEEYEKAAYRLEVGETSGIVEGKGVNQKGSTVSCFYIIKRLPLESEYIEKNFETLKNDYIDSVVYSMLAEKKAELTFKPTDEIENTRLSELSAPKAYNPWLEITLACALSVAALASLAAVIIVVIRRRRSGGAK